MLRFSPGVTYGPSSIIVLGGEPCKRRKVETVVSWILALETDRMSVLLYASVTPVAEPTQPTPNGKYAKNSAVIFNWQRHIMVKYCSFIVLSSEVIQLLPTHQLMVNNGTSYMSYSHLFAVCSHPAHINNCQYFTKNFFLKTLTNWFSPFLLRCLEVVTYRSQLY
jgi:hypothetical protein